MRTFHRSHTKASPALLTFTALVIVLQIACRGSGDTASSNAAPTSVAPPAPPVVEEPLEPELASAPDATVRASSEMPDLGASGVLLAKNPGWHGRKEPKYPEWLEVRLKQPQAISTVELLPQYQNAARAPGTFEIQTSTNGSTWTTALRVEQGCAGDAGRWRAFPLPTEVTTTRLRLLIHANCGDPTLLTLRGLRFK